VTAAQASSGQPASAEGEVTDQAHTGDGTQGNPDPVAKTATQDDHSPTPDNENTAVTISGVTSTEVRRSMHTMGTPVNTTATENGDKTVIDDAKYHGPKDVNAQGDNAKDATNGGVNHDATANTGVANDAATNDRRYAVAVWTRAEKSVFSSTPGFGFVGISGSLDNNRGRKFLNTELRPYTSLTGHTEAFTEQEKAWTPIGRAVVGTRAFIFRKRYLGAHAGRDGNTMSTFLVGHDQYAPSLVDLLLMTDQAWERIERAAGDNPGRSLPDVSAQALDSHPIPALTGVDAQRCVQTLRLLIDGSRVDASSLDLVTMLAIAFALPGPVRRGLILSPISPTSPGGSELSLLETSAAGVSLPTTKDDVPLPGALGELAMMLRPAQSVADCRRLLARPARAQEASGETADQADREAAGKGTVSGAPQDISELLTEWLSNPGRVSIQIGEALLDHAEEVLIAMVGDQLQLPNDTRPGPVTIGLLKCWTDVQQSEQVRQVLPDSASSCAALVSLAPTDAAMVALCIRNAEDVPEVVVPKALTADRPWPAAVLRAVRADPTGSLSRGLRAMLAASYTSDSTFLRTLALHPDEDPALWFDELVPQSLPEEGIGVVVGLNPEAFVRHHPIRPPYDSVIVKMLKPDDISSGLFAFVRNFVRRQRGRR
jgi:hypothetical protein